MTEWFGPNLTNGCDIAWGVVIARVVLSLVLGYVIAGVYCVLPRSARVERSPFATTLVLLTILIAMVTLVIGNSVARAFSLVGALAIVRFRTIVEDTRDTAFVIFAVVVGMSVGAGFLLVPLVGIPAVAAAALLFGQLQRLSTQERSEFTLELRVQIVHDPRALFHETFQRRLVHVELQALKTCQKGAALDMTYLVRLRRGQDPIDLLDELRRLEGVSGVTLT